MKEIPNNGYSQQAKAINYYYKVEKTRDPHLTPVPRAAWPRASSRHFMSVMSDISHLVLLSNKDYEYYELLSGTHPAVRLYIDRERRGREQGQRPSPDAHQQGAAPTVAQLFVL